jgi:mandelamide amidase
MTQGRAAAPAELHELSLVAAARALEQGEVCAEEYASELLMRARAHADLDAFITIDESSVYSAAVHADRELWLGRRAPLLGVPLAIKDSYLTRGLATTFGTSALNGFVPTRDAEIVLRLKEAGAIVFGKNNLVEMSYGVTGLNAHYGQVRNPYDRQRVSGGSSSGGSAAVAARLVPAALGGDTIGSIRVPAALCGVVGYKPTPGRWPSGGVAPISGTLDSAGVLARSAEDCELLDAVVTSGLAPSSSAADHLNGVKLAHAPRQYFTRIDAEVETAFRETLQRLHDAGAELVEIDLGEDFFALADRTTWPLFFYETLPALRGFLSSQEVPVSFEQIHAGLGERIKATWSRAVVPGGPGRISDERYWQARSSDRRELCQRFASLVFSRAHALVFPTTPCVAPRIDEQWQFEVAGSAVNDLFLARHTHPTNAAGLPGISVPIALSSRGLPIGIEVDGPAGRDRELLTLARRIENVIGPLPGPAGI